jgi:hypothetical protein
MTKVRVEIYVAMNEDGDAYIADDAAAAAEGLADNYGGICCQVTHIIAKISPPIVADAMIDIPDPAKAAGTLVDVEAA